MLIDHSAKTGHGSADASTLHRIDEAFARQDFGKRGLRVVAHSDALRHADDPREQISYQPPMLGKTDRFVLVFRPDAVDHDAIDRKLLTRPHTQHVANFYLLDFDIMLLTVANNMRVGGASDSNSRIARPYAFALAAPSVDRATPGP